MLSVPDSAVSQSAVTPASPGPPPSAPSTTEQDVSAPARPTQPMREGPMLLSLPSHVHIEDVYLKAGASKKAAFEVRNDGPDTLTVELASRGGGEIDFWQETSQDKKEPSKSSNVSLPSSRQSATHPHRPASPLPPSSQPLRSITLDPFSSVSVHFTFVPPPTQACSPAITEDPAALVTPKAMPVNSDLLLATPVPGGPLRGAMQKAPTWWLDGDEAGPIATNGVEPPVESIVVLAKEPPATDGGQSGEPSKAASGSTKCAENADKDAVKSSFSVHGDLVFVASRFQPNEINSTSPQEGDPEGPRRTEDPSQPCQRDGSQTFTVPYAASICESVFSASATPSAASTSPESSIPFQGSLSYSSQLSLDFGSALSPRTAVSREFVVKNASEIPLALSSAIVFDSSPWQVWAVLEDLESGEKFPLGGEGTDGRKVTLLPSIAPLQSRRLGLSVYVGEGGGDDAFFLDVLLCNLNNAGNTLLVQASGSSAIDPAADQNILQVLSGGKVNFGSIIRGSTVRHLIRVKNTGDEPIEVVLGKEVGWDVKFLFGGVKGDELLNDEAGMGTVVEQGEVTSTLPGGVAGPSTVADPEGAHFLGRAGPSTFVGGSESGRLLHPKPVSAVDRVFSGGAPRSSSPFRPSSNLSSATESNSSVDGGASSSSALDSSGDRSLHQTTSRQSDDQLSSMPSEPSSSSMDPTTSSSFFQPPPISPPRSSRSSVISPTPAPASQESLLRRPRGPESAASSITANQIEELVMRPGTEYRVWLSFTPSQEIPLFVDPGSLVSTSFRVTLDYSPSSTATVTSKRATKSPYRRRKIIACEAAVCSTNLQVVPSVLDFGQVTVGSSKSSSIAISNLSDLPAEIELRFISKVLSASRIFITIPPRETTVERIDFFPRRINSHYTKQLNVRSLLDRTKDQMVVVHAQNVDLDGVTLHSHLYKIYTPSGLNFVDFGSVIVNSPAIRTITVKNVQATNLLLHFAAAHPEDLAIYAKATDPPVKAAPPSESGQTDRSSEPEKPPKSAPVSNRERFLESMASRGEPDGRFPTVGRANRLRDKSAVRGAPAAEGESHPKPINMVNALKKGSKGRTVALYGNVVILKDRSLLSGSEYLDLAGPPLAPHRMPSPSQRIHLLTTIENEDKSKLSGKFPKIAKTVFGESKAHKAKVAAAHSTAVNPTDPSAPTTTVKPPSTPKKKVRCTTHEPASQPGSQDTVVPSAYSTTPGVTAAQTEEVRSPALTGKRKQRAEPVDAADVSRLSLDELVSAIEHRELIQTIKGGTRESEELYVRTTVNLKAALQSAIDTGKLVPVSTLSVAGGTDQQLVLVLKPNGSTRPQVQGDRSRRQDSRILIRLVDFDRSLGAFFPGLDVEDDKLPTRELLVRSNMTRSVLDVAQTHINFGNLEKGDSKSKTIIIHNRSESSGLFRIRLSGKISSNDFKLGEGRYGVVQAFGKKEVAGFIFTPSMPGLFSESIIVENVQDGDNDMVVSVKATVRKTYSFWVSPLDLAVPDVDFSQPLDAHASLFSITNSSKGERSFIVEVDPPQPELAYPCALSVQLSDGESKAALTKAEDEELENILQKLKIARRKAKPDKIEKYEARLIELGVPIPLASTDQDPSPTPPTDAKEPKENKESKEPKESKKPKEGKEPKELKEPKEPKEAATNESTPGTPRSSSPPQKTTPPSSKIVTPPSSTRIAVQLGAGQSQTIKAGLCALFGPAGPPSTVADVDDETGQTPDLPDLKFTLRIWEKKNSDDVRVVNVVVSRKKPVPPPSDSPADASALSAEASSTLVV